MAKPAALEKLPGLASRFGAFIAERHPLALADALDAFEKATGGREPAGEKAIEAVGQTLQHELKRRLLSRAIPHGLPDTTPRTTAAARVNQAYAELLDAADGFLRRAAITASLTDEERLEMLRGMVLTRATDNRLKTFFTAGEIKYGAASFQGKGFRSLGQEAIYAAAIRLRRGARYRGATTGSAKASADRATWTGDVIGPVIRDLGVTLAMRPEPDTVRMVLNAQMGKTGAPLEGKDLHIGDFGWGILPPAAPLTP